MKGFGNTLNLREIYIDLHRRGKYNYGGKWHPRYFDAIDLVKATDAKTVLDCACEWGQVISRLCEIGYCAEGTTWIPECVKYNRGMGRTVYARSYEDLFMFDSGSYDCVLSNDVLEHLESESAAEAAISQMARISKKWLAITIGANPAPNNAKRYGLNDLHFISRDAEWWKSIISKYISVLPTPPITPYTKRGFFKKRPGPDPVGVLHGMGTYRAHLFLARHE